MLPRFTTIVLVLVAALMLAACGGDDEARSDAGSGDDSAETSDDSGTDAGDDGSDDTAGGGTTLDLTAKGTDLRYDKSELTAPAGSVTLTFTNGSTLQHNVAIEDEDGEELEVGKIVGEDGVSEVTVDLEPGTYTYFCSPHKGAGMDGTLTVT